jgi:hypothetical protein
MLVHQIARQLRRTQPPTLTQLADLYPERRPMLLKMVQQLREAAELIRQRSQLVGRVTGNVLSHLNATVRLIAGASGGPSIYTRNGATPMPAGARTLSLVG